jgi:hypothetical protein
MSGDKNVSSADLEHRNGNGASGDLVVPIRRVEVSFDNSPKNAAHHFTVVDTAT